VHGDVAGEGVEQAEVLVRGVADLPVEVASDDVAEQAAVLDLRSIVRERAGSDGVDIVKLVLNPVFGGSSAAMDLLDKAKQFATNFVDNVFKPDVEGKWRGFVDTCAATDRSVREIHQRITAEANTTNDHPFSAFTGTLPPVTASRHKPGADHQLGNPRADDGGDRTQVAGNPAQLHPQQVQHTPTTPPPVAHAGLGIPRDASRPQPVPAVSPQAFMPPRPSGLLSPDPPRRLV